VSDQPSDELHRLRQGCYRLLAAGFEPVSDEFLAIAGDSLTVLDGIGLFDFAFGPHLAGALRRFAESDGSELRGAYVELFETGTRGEVFALRETAHLGDPRTGDTARILAELRECYERFGLEATTPPGQLDHVSTELGVMAALCGATVGLGGRERDLAVVLGRQTAFAREHVLRWVPRLGRRLVETAAHPTYAALGAATLAFLEHERQHLPILVGLEAGTDR